MTIDEQPRRCEGLTKYALVMTEELEFELEPDSDILVDSFDALDHVVIATLRILELIWREERASA